VAAPTYLEQNGRLAVPSRLRPAAGETLEVLVLPRPPLTTATLANADQGAVASVSWVDDDGTGHLEPLWQLVELPTGGQLQPAPEGRLPIDLYGGSFVRVRAGAVDLVDGQPHAFGFELASSAGPGGATIGSVAELRQLGGVVWYDAGGQLGHVKAPGGADYTVAELADAVHAGAVAFGSQDVTDPAHPALVLASTPVGDRRRVTLGDLVACIGNDPATVLQLADAGGTEVDVVGAGVLPPVGPQPGDRWSSGVTVPELARAVGVALPAGGTGPVVDRLELAIATAEDAIGRYLGRPTVADWPAGATPAGPHVAVLQVATRIYRAADVTFGVLQTELGTAYTGRWLTPELDAALLGWRRSWGIA
jgi:hypothetical protein